MQTNKELKEFMTVEDLFPVDRMYLSYVDCLLDFYHPSCFALMQLVGRIKDVEGRVLQVQTIPKECKDFLKFYWSAE